MLSTTKVEYRATTHAVKEALWMCAFLGEIMRSLSTPMMLHCDNQSAIMLSKDGQHHARMKHINLQFHLIHETVTNCAITLIYCPMQMMVADILMKLLSHGKTGEHASSLRLLPP